MNANTGGGSSSNPDKKPNDENSPRLPNELPLITRAEDAEALSEKENDPFYITAFLIQSWLGALILHVRAEYAEKKEPRERLLQKGEAWRLFQEIFDRSKHEEPEHLISCLQRFSRAEQSSNGSLSRALALLSIEHNSSAAPTSDLRPPASDSGSPLHAPSSPLIGPALPLLCRWSDWLEAVVHFRAHRHWHLAPICFDPDAEKRELAALGTAERHITKLSPRTKAYLQWYFPEAAERYKDSTKWLMVGKAMSAESDRLWPHRHVDLLAITLWPLVKKHNWTYRDLLNVIRPSLTRHSSRHSQTPSLHHSTFGWPYPCDREQDFAAYCTNVLGLRKTGKGITAKNGRPAGFEIASALRSLTSDL